MDGAAAVNSGVSEGSDADISFLVGVDGVAAESSERSTPRPLSPTKLLPFITNSHRNPSDADLDALRRRLHHAPRPLKKRSSITEPEGPAGPNIQKLLYQKTTLAAMETIPMEGGGSGGGLTQPGVHDDGTVCESVTSNDDAFNQLMNKSPEDNLTPPPLPPRSPIPDSATCRPPPAPPEDKEEEEVACAPAPVSQDYFKDEFPPYPPPPYPSCGEGEQGGDLYLKPPEVTGQVTAPPVSVNSALFLIGV